MDTSAVAGLKPVTLWLQDVSNQMYKSGKKYRDRGVLEKHFEMLKSKSEWFKCVDITILLESQASFHTCQTPSKLPVNV